MTENEIAKIIVNTCYNIHIGLGLGLLININEKLIKDGITRIVNNL